MAVHPRNWTREHSVGAGPRLCMLAVLKAWVPGEPGCYFLPGMLGMDWSNTDSKMLAASLICL